VDAPTAFRQQLLGVIPSLRRYARSLVFDRHAADFSRAMGHLDRAATKQLDKVEFDHRLRLRFYLETGHRLGQ